MTASTSGIHFVLFCICMFILVRNRRSTQWFILASAFVMFALSTADISLSFRVMTHDLRDRHWREIINLSVAFNSRCFEHLPGELVGDAGFRSLNPCLSGNIAFPKGWDQGIVRDAPDWVKSKNPDAPAVKREAKEDWSK